MQKYSVQAIKNDTKMAYNRIVRTIVYKEI